MVGPRVGLLGLACAATIATLGQASDVFWPECSPPKMVSHASYVTPACQCGQVQPVRYACATPAPASPGPGVLSSHQEPPLAKSNKGPVISQNRIFSGVQPSLEPRTSTAKVSFWNLSGLDVTLAIGERTHSIPRDRAVILDLDRQFTWRTNFHNPKTEEVPDDVNHFEVMIR